MTEMRTILSPETVFEEECLPELRWVPRSMLQAGDYKLQQRWAILGVTNGQVTTKSYQWRDVPTVIDDWQF